MNCSRYTDDALVRSFLSRFEPYGVSKVHGGTPTFLVLMATAFLVLGLLVGHEDAPAEAYWLASAMLPLAVLLALRRVHTRLDLDGGAVVETWRLVFPYRSRRRALDLSQVREVRLETVHTVSHLPSVGSGGPWSREETRRHFVHLVGASPGFVYKGSTDPQTRSAAEYFAVALGVPLRLVEDEVRTPTEICEPLRDRLARSLPPAPTSPPPVESRLTVEKDEATGTTRFLVPAVGAVRVIVQPSILFTVVIIALLISTSGLRRGLAMGAAVAAGTAVSLWFRTHRSEEITILADGGLEVSRRFPVGGYRRRIAGADLEAVHRHGDFIITAEGRRRSIWFGLGLTSDELEWLELAVCRAMAETSFREPVRV